MGLVLDASVLIAAERQTFDLPGFLASVADETVALCSITVSELLHGAERAKDPMTRARRSQSVEGLLDDLVVLPFGLAEARVHARIWAALAAKGKLIGAHDLQVAATAIAIGSAVATLNQKEFKRVPGLSLLPIAEFTKA